MPDFGVTKAAARTAAREAAAAALRDASKGAKVVRPGEVRAQAPVIEPVRVAPPQDAVLNPPPAAEPIDLTAAQAAAPKPLNMTPGQVDSEAAKIANADLKDFDLSESHQVNFDTLQTTDDVKGVVAAIAEQNKGRVDVPRRGVVTNEQLAALSSELDVDEGIVRKVMERETGGVLNPETIYGARKVLKLSGQRLTALRNKVVTKTANDLERLQFRRQFQFHGEFYAQFMGARAESGRSLNAFGIPIGDDPGTLKRVGELVDTMYTDTDQLAAKLMEIDTESGLNSFVGKYNGSRVIGTLNEVFVNSILSGPRTHLVNTVGNVLMSSMNVAETAVAARIGKFFNSAERVEIGEATALMHGQLSGIRDGLRLAGRAMRTGRTIDDVSKFETSHVKAISAEAWLNPKWQATPLGRALDILGAVVRVPTERVMAPTDEFFKTIAYRAEMERQAYLHVLEQIDSGAITQADAARVAREFLESNATKAQDAADSYAKYVTFQNPLGDTGRAFQRFADSMPATRLIVPFIRTPTNIFKASLLDRSPVAFFTRKFYADMAQGGRVRDMALARVTMGSATSAFVVWQVVEGNISGAGPRDPEARKLLESTGWKPYSVRDQVTGRWHSYARLEPIASVIGATADTVEIGSYVTEDSESMKDENQQMVDATAAIIAGIANNTMSKTFMKGMSDFTEMLSDPGRYAQNWGGEMAQAAVPYSAARRQIAASTDPYLREAWTINDKLAVASGIPGWSEDAPPRRDFFGNPRKHGEGSILGSMSPIPDSKIKHDPTTDELVALMRETRQVPVTMPAKSVEGMRLNAQEYDDLVMISRTEPIFGGSRNFKEELERVMTTGAYQRATPFYKVQLLKSTQTQADEIARQLLPKRNPEYAERKALYDAKNSRLLYGK